MSAQSIEKRLAALEADIAEIRKRLDPSPANKPEAAESWVDKIYGTFANDPIYDEAMRLGRKYRESLRPRPKKKKKRKGKNATA